MLDLNNDGFLCGYGSFSFAQAYNDVAGSVLRIERIHFAWKILVQQATTNEE
jgi:hypothetical protein